MRFECISIMIRRMIPNRVKQEIRKILFKNSTEYRLLKRTCGQPRFILLDTPLHGNLGDQAIAIAERKFINEKFPDIPIIEFSHSDCCRYMCEIHAKCSERDTYLIHGGGFIGTLWKNEQETIVHVLKTIRESKIVIFPQTIFFDKTFLGEKMKMEFMQIISKCKNLTIFVRDEKSYAWMRKECENINVKYDLVPDIVTTLDYQKRYVRDNRVLLCLRKDLEKTSKFDVEFIRKIVEGKNYTVEMTDTIVNHNVFPKKRLYVVEKKLEQFNKVALVITDRLHGLIFSAITATPCIAVDNISKKVSGGYRWLEHLDYVKCIEECEINEEMISQMLDMRECIYSQSINSVYYEKIVDALRG